MAVVVLKLAIEGNSTTFNVPCYVLQSNKPLWIGNLYDYALVLGTNALETLGIRITNPNGELVSPVGKRCQSAEVQAVKPSSNNALERYSKKRSFFLAYLQDLAGC